LRQLLLLAAQVNLRRPAKWKLDRQAVRCRASCQGCAFQTCRTLDGAGEVVLARGIGRGLFELDVEEIGSQRKKRPKEYRREAQIPQHRDTTIKKVVDKPQTL
jgi:hypothetical protein